MAEAVSQLCMLRMQNSYTTGLVTQGLQEMYTAQILTDLALFDDDENKVGVHSCVLAAVSPVVKNHLTQAESGNAVQALSFPNISVTEWKLILDFIYLGEVYISVEQLPKMTTILEVLDIRELFDLCTISESSVYTGTLGTNLAESLTGEDTLAHMQLTTPVSTNNTALPTQSLQEKKQQCKRAGQSLLKQAPSFLNSSRFTKPSMNPGRGSQCPYTKEGTLAKHRLAPVAMGKISGPFGTVEISTESMDNEEIMRQVNQAFFGTRGEPSRKKRKTVDVSVESNKSKHQESDSASTQQLLRDNLVKIKAEGTNETGEEYVVLSAVQKPNNLEDSEDITMDEDMQDNDTEPIGQVEKKATPKKKSKKTMYKCTLCDLEFVYGPKLKEHEQAHRLSLKEESGAKRFACDTCDKEFNSERSLTFHMRMNCTPLHSCTFCSEKFHFRYQLDTHILTSHAEESESLFPDEKLCGICGEKFASDALLSHHKGKVHRGWKTKEATSHESIVCKKCAEHFKKSEDLEHHMKYNHTPASCEYCQEEFDSQLDMMGHLQECGQAPPGEAGKQIAQMMSQQPAQQSGGKAAGKPVNCPHCQALFPSKSALVRHNDQEHGGKDMTFCTMCNKKFQSIRAFRNHMMRHYGIRPFACTECTRKFTDQRDLDKHKSNAHGTVRPHQCPHCDWAFKDVSALYNHGKRKHNVVLSRARHLVDPNQTLSDEVLGKLLLKECLLKKEVETVTCVLCDSKFQRRGNMYVHARQVHKKDVHKVLKAAMKKHGLRFLYGGQVVDSDGTSITEQELNQLTELDEDEQQQVEVAMKEGLVVVHSLRQGLLNTQSRQQPQQQPQQQQNMIYQDVTAAGDNVIIQETDTSEHSVIFQTATTSDPASNTVFLQGNEIVTSQTLFQPLTQSEQEQVIFQVADQHSEDQQQSMMVIKEEGDHEEMMLVPMTGTEEEAVLDSATGAQHITIITQDGEGGEGFCPLCEKDCGDKDALLQHGKEIHDVDFVSCNLFMNEGD